MLDELQSPFRRRILMFIPTDENEDRREFLKTCGRFAAVTPPALTMLLSTSLTSTAIANSGGGGDNRNGNNGNHYGWNNGNNGNRYGQNKN
jgi:hypothetical protein